jgi:hypothetical protein
LLSGKPLPDLSKGNQRRTDQAKQSLTNPATEMNINQIVRSIKNQQPAADVDVAKIISRLNANGVVVKNEQSTVAEIAKENKLNPEEVLQIISTGSKKEPSSQPNSRITPPAEDKRAIPAERKANQDNRKNDLLKISLNQLAAQYNLPASDLITALKNNGIAATADQTVEEISVASGKKPGQILQILRSTRK